jgi:hypothetical protein
VNHIIELCKIADDYEPSEIDFADARIKKLSNKKSFLLIYKSANLANEAFATHQKNPDSRFELRLWHPKVDVSMRIPPVHKNKYGPARDRRRPQ